jgi:transposase
MRGSPLSQEDLAKLEQIKRRADAGEKAAHVCNELGVATATYYNWKSYNRTGPKRAYQHRKMAPATLKAPTHQTLVIEQPHSQVIFIKCAPEQLDKLLQVAHGK